MIHLRDSIGSMTSSISKGGRDVDRFAMLVHARDHLVEEGLALLRILDRRDLVAIAELDRAFEPHAAELAGRPGDGEQRAP